MASRKAECDNALDFQSISGWHDAGTLRWRKRHAEGNRFEEDKGKNQKQSSSILSQQYHTLILTVWLLAS